MFVCVYVPPVLGRERVLALAYSSSRQYVRIVHLADVNYHSINYIEIYAIYIILSYLKLSMMVKVNSVS